MITTDQQLDTTLAKYTQHFGIEIVLNDWNDGKEFLYKANKTFMSEFFREGTSFYFPVYESALLFSKAQDELPSDGGKKQASSYLTCKKS